MNSNWALFDIGSSVLMVFVGLTCALFPMKMIWFALNWPKWSYFGLFRDEDYYPAMREAKRLFDTDKRKFVEEYAGYILGLRFFGVLMLCWMAMFISFGLLPALSSNGRTPLP